VVVSSGGTTDAVPESGLRIDSEVSLGRREGRESAAFRAESVCTTVRARSSMSGMAVTPLMAYTTCVGSSTRGDHLHKKSRARNRKETYQYRLRFWN
jgi:hypothetical protein